ncbi:MAG: hypothetical protein IPH93_16290 [Saprospiraceae bacterium]|nr:hypothetical protein [Saprospiraceae bacterium]
MAQITKYYLLTFLIGISSIVKAQKPNYESSLLIIRNINVVDVTTGKILQKQDVVVKDQLIIFIGKSFTESVSTNPKYIDGKGKYLCPGLWDMHFHLCWDKNNNTLLYPALLKNGITGIRDMGGDLKIMNSFKAESQKFKPDIYGAGPMIDGNPPVYFDFTLPVDDKTNITAVLGSLKIAGLIFSKPIL